VKTWKYRPERVAQAYAVLAILSIACGLLPVVFGLAQNQFDC
jgi:hypothetical protein